MDLCRMGTIVDVAKQMHLSWDTVKDILESDIFCKYSCPDFKGL